MNAIEQIAITKIKGIGPKSCKLLLAYFGSLHALFQSSRSQLNAIPGISKQVVETILSKKYMQEAESEYRFAEKHGIDVLWFEDERYPRRLRNCDDAPLLLFSKGKVDYNKQKVVSVVGTRNATNYGRKLTEELLGGIGRAEVLVCSGLAFGIDIIAHKAANSHNIPNVAVLGNGLDRIYPYEHLEVALKIMENGSLLSEFTSGTKPDKTNFPMRNRIIAGLADVTVVVEAADKGGALITADIANSYNRDVCAYPGNVDQPYSNGCNQLIQMHQAHLIRNSKDLLQLMRWEIPSEPKKDSGVQLSMLQDLNADEEKVFGFLKDAGQALIDELANYCDWPQSKLAIVLLELELKGLIQSLPGKIYKLL